MRMGNDPRCRLATQIDAHMAMMCHCAILDGSGDGEATTWLEPVADYDYVAAAASCRRSQTD